MVFFCCIAGVASFWVRHKHSACESSLNWLSENFPIFQERKKICWSKKPLDGKTADEKKKSRVCQKYRAINNEKVA